MAMRGGGLLRVRNMNIDPTFRDALPELPPKSLAELEVRILREGCRDPLVTWNGTLIDGHNRYSICKRHNLQFDTVEMEFADKDAALLWVKRTHLARRNLTPDQFKLLLGEIYNAEKKPRRGTGSNQHVRRSSENQNLSEKTAVRVAREFGVSHDTVSKAGRLASAVAQVKADKPELPEPEVIREAKDRVRKATPPNHNGAARPSDVDTRTVRSKRTAKQAITKAVDMIASLISAFDALADADPSREEVQHWEKELAASASAISRFRRDLKERFNG